MQGNESITRYSRYFRVVAPEAGTEIAILLLLGVVFGSVSITIDHLSSLRIFDYRLVVIGATIGILTISIPAFLTVLLVKAMNRRMLVKHAVLSTNFIVLFYGLAILLVSFVLLLAKNQAIAYTVLLLANAGIYGYWFVMGNVVIGIRKKNAAIASAIHPVLNVLFFLPFSVYLFGVHFPVNATLVKLFFGMLVFLVASYSFLYFVDRPAKRLLDASGVKLMSSMLSYWLYNFSSEAKAIGYSAASSRDLEASVLTIRNSKGYAAVFANTDIHFGPFANAGGSIAPAYLGNKIAKQFGAAPFVLHSTVSMQDNPVSSSEIYPLANRLLEAVGSSKKFVRARGSVSFGSSGRCTAIDIRIADSRLIVLSKAPYVTEDIERAVGKELKEFAQRLAGTEHVVLVDAHNSRFETAPKSELEGIGKGSKYIADYKKAIEQAVSKERNSVLKMGFSYRRLSELVGKRKDLGEGYSSVCVIGSDHNRFCLVYFDANNMLPKFREEVIKHINEKFNMKAELCTTDTHSINLISEDASNALGRYTKANDILPVLDLMIGSAIGSMDYSEAAYESVGISNFRVWGPNAAELIRRTGYEIRRTFKRVVPFIIIAAFVIAAWVLSIV